MITKIQTIQDPLVSVIIPNYNYERYLTERIESVVNQTYNNYEVIILDDNSTDNSRDIIELYRHNSHVSQIIYNNNNSGSPFLQWELGIKHAKGEWIWIAESDDTSDLDFLSSIMTEIKKVPDTVIAFSHSYMISSSGEKMDINWDKNKHDGKTYIYNSQDFIHQKLIWNSYIYNASMAVFKRSIVQSINKNYRNYRSCGDWSFWMEICSKGKIIEVCKQLNYFRQHPQRATECAAKSGSDWKEVASVLNSFIVYQQLEGFELRAFRGKWTKDLNESRCAFKQEIKDSFPEVFKDDIMDYASYRILYLIRLFKSKFQ